MHGLGMRLVLDDWHDVYNYPNTLVKTLFHRIDNKITFSPLHGNIVDIYQLISLQHMSIDYLLSPV